eukprot:Platyproteum_vivax@DN5397_c0_g1_i1.p1
MSGLRYWTAQCILEYSATKDILSFSVVCKLFKSFWDDEAVKRRLTSEFKEILFNLDFDAERRKYCKMTSNAHWLSRLEQNLLLIINSKRRFVKNEKSWRVQGCDINDLQLPKAMKEQISLNLPFGYKIISAETPTKNYFVELNDDVYNYGKCVAVVAQPPFKSITEVWISRPPSRSGSRDPDYSKAVLPLSCMCIRELHIFEASLYLLSRAGVVWFLDQVNSEDFVQLWCLEPVFKVCGRRLLSVTGRVYEHLNSNIVTRIPHPNIKFTDMCLNERMGMYIMIDRGRKFYEHPKSIKEDSVLFKRIEFETFVPPSFVWADWSVGNFFLTLVTKGRQVWQWDLLQGAQLIKEHKNVAQKFSHAQTHSG